MDKQYFLKFEIERTMRHNSTRRNTMNRVPDAELVLVPGGSLITAAPEEGRALALTMAAI